MKVEMIPEILSISGRIGNQVYRTRYDANGQPHVFASRMPSKRSTPPTPRETAHRTRFGAISRAVRLKQQAGDSRPRKTIWDEVAADYDAHNPDAGCPRRG